MKRVKLICGLFTIMILTGCNGTVTKELRHNGFSVSDEEFICDYLIKDDLVVGEVKYLTNDFAILNNNKIYALSIGQKFSNEKNCKELKSIKVLSIIDNKIFLGEDNKLYYTPTSKSEVIECTTKEDDYYLYKALLNDGNVKIISIDQTNGIYYILSDDGNVYEVTINTETFTELNRKLIYDHKNYDGKIVDFNFSYNNLNSQFIKTNTSYYRNQTTNLEECSMYADVLCQYKFSKDTVMTEYEDNILHYNGDLLITTYGKIFNIS